MTLCYSMSSTQEGLFMVSVKRVDCPSAAGISATVPCFGAGAIRSLTCGACSPLRPPPSAGNLSAQDEMRRMEDAHGSVSVRTWITADDCATEFTGRITEGDLAAQLESFGPGTNPLVFVCGPSEMIDWAALHLSRLGLARDRIRLERWW